jgi:hypothetical protein
MPKKFILLHFLNLIIHISDPTSHAAVNESDYILSPLITVYRLWMIMVIEKISLPKASQKLAPALFIIIIGVPII